MRGLEDRCQTLVSVAGGRSDLVVGIRICLRNSGVSEANRLSDVGFNTP